MELSELYSEKIIEIAGNLPVLVRLPDPDASARKVSRICGSVVEVDLNFEQGRVTGYSHDVSACALGQTSASVVARNVLGSTPGELRALRDTMFDMLKHDGPPPTGKWGDLRYLEPVREYPARHASTMLVFEAIVDCLDQVEKAPAQ